MGASQILFLKTPHYQDLHIVFLILRVFLLVELEMTAFVKVKNRFPAAMMKYMLIEMSRPIIETILSI